MGIDFFNKVRKLFWSADMSVSHVHVCTASDRPMSDAQLSRTLGESLHIQLLQSYPDYKTLWYRSVEKGKIAIRDRPYVFLMSFPKPVSIKDLVQYLEYQTVQVLEGELHCSISQQKGRIFMAGCYHDPKATTSPVLEQLVLPWSQGSSEPDDEVDPVIAARIVFFEE